MTVPVLTAESLTKTYATTHAVNQISLAVNAGESVAIMGPSGSGKTTLMHLLSGILTPDTGRVTFTSSTEQLLLSEMNAEARAKARRRQIGFVFQDGLLLPELTALENVAVALMVDGVPRKQAEADAAAWLQSLGLAGMEQRRPAELSGGQAQRVAIARAQVSLPGIVFADEPTGALDSQTSEDVMTALLASTAQRGAPLVVVTHDPAVAARCSRLIRLQDGKLIQDSVQNVVQNPQQNAQVQS